MAIVAQCTNCGKKYKVADTAAGKQVKCQACGSTFKVPQPAVAQVGSGGGTATLQSSAAGTMQVLAKRYGLAPLPANENQIFPEQPIRRAPGQDPLANHVVYDAGFSNVSVADYNATQLPKEQSMHDYMAEIEREEGWGESKPKEEMNPIVLYSIMGVGPIVCGLIGGVVALLGQESVAFWVMLVPMAILGMLMNGIIWQTVQENDDSTQAFLCWMFPPYYLYYVATNWSAMMHVFLASLLFGFTSMFGIVLYVVLSIIGGGGEPPA